MLRPYYPCLLAILKTVGQNEPYGSDISPPKQAFKRSFYSFKNLKLAVYHVKILFLQRVSVKTRVAPTRNRARVSRVVGGDSTTEPAIRLNIPSCFHLVGSRVVFSRYGMQRDMGGVVSVNTHPRRWRHCHHA